MSKRLNLVLSDEEEQRLLDICDRYNLSMSQAIRNLIMDNKVPTEIENKEVIEKLSEISNRIKALVMKDNIPSVDQIVLIEFVNSIKELLKD